MEELQLLRFLLVGLLAQQQTEALGGQCVDESLCPYSLQDYYSQLVNLPSRINERSVAPWSYAENIDLNRVPQVLHEASCHTSHSCRGLNNEFGLETVPVTLRIPVLKKSSACFPTTTYSLEFELVTVACMCAVSRYS
ncbi:interleukin-25 [Gasterosteus aculeatus]